MEIRHPMTTEDLRKKFSSQFELVNYAIKLAENMIRTGRDSRVKSEIQNRALQVLEEISLGKDKFDEIIVPQKVKQAPNEGGKEFREFSKEKGRGNYSSHRSDSRKASKAFQHI